MLGAIALVVFMVAIFPVGFFLTGAIVSAIHGALFTAYVEEAHEGSELIALNA